MEVFLSGFFGALTGGLVLAGVTFLLFTYEKKQANKKADKLVNELKSIYTEKLNQGLERAGNVHSGKFN